MNAPAVSREVMDRRFQLFDSMLSLFPPGTLVDLGAGHGAFSRRAAKAGWRVTAIDARADRFPKDPSVEWKVSDVRDVDLGQYDVVACLGLFYHLTLDDQLDFLQRCAGRPLILDTHVDNGHSEHTLSERERIRGYTGSWYREPGQLTSSWGNDRSFWPTPESLQQMLADTGHPVVLTAEPGVTPNRTFYLSIPPAGAPGSR
jgi:SAM-dependent methyltransferase